MADRDQTTREWPEPRDGERHRVRRIMTGETLVLECRSGKWWHGDMDFPPSWMPAWAEYIGPEGSVN